MLKAGGRLLYNPRTHEWADESTLKPGSYKVVKFDPKDADKAESRAELEKEVRDGISGKNKGGSGSNLNDWAPWILAGGGGLLAHSIASSILDDENENKKSVWRKLLSTLMPIGIGGLGAYGGYLAGRSLKTAQARQEEWYAPMDQMQEADDSFKVAPIATGVGLGVPAYFGTRYGWRNLEDWWNGGPKVRKDRSGNEIPPPQRIKDLQDRIAKSEEAERADAAQRIASDVERAEIDRRNEYNKKLHEAQRNAQDEAYRNEVGARDIQRQAQEAARKQEQDALDAARQRARAEAVSDQQAADTAAENAYQRQLNGRRQAIDPSVVAARKATLEAELQRLGTSGRAIARANQIRRELESLSPRDIPRPPAPRAPRNTPQARIVPPTVMPPPAKPAPLPEFVPEPPPAAKPSLAPSESSSVLRGQMRKALLREGLKGLGVGGASAAGSLYLIRKGLNNYEFQDGIRDWVRRHPVQAGPVQTGKTNPKVAPKKSK